MYKKKDVKGRCLDFAQIMGLVAVCFWSKNTKVAFSADTIWKDVSKELSVERDDVQIAIDRMQLSGYLENFSAENKTPEGKEEITEYWVLTESGFEFLKLFEF